MQVYKLIVVVLFLEEPILNMTNITFLHFKFIQILIYKILMFNLFYDRMLLNCKSHMYFQNELLSLIREAKLAFLIYTLINNMLLYLVKPITIKKTMNGVFSSLKFLPLFPHTLVRSIDRNLIWVESRV